MTDPSAYDQIRQRASDELGYEVPVERVAQVVRELKGRARAAGDPARGQAAGAALLDSVRIECSLRMRHSRDVPWTVETAVERKVR